MQVSVELNLSELAKRLTNNPNPRTIHGKPPEHRIRLASLDSFLGLFSSSTPAGAPNTEARTFYYLSDHLGTAQLLVDQEQTIVWKGEFKPFGQVDTIINDLDNNFRFPGQYFDGESGLYQNWHRYYDPAVGRYVSADPIGLAGGINLYGYAGSDSVNGLDPSGLKCRDCEQERTDCRKRANNLYIKMLDMEQEGYESARKRLSTAEAWALKQCEWYRINCNYVAYKSCRVGVLGLYAMEQGALRTAHVALMGEIIAAWGVALTGCELDYQTCGTSNRIECCDN